MRNKFGTFCMTLGIVLVLSALSLFIWNQREAQEAADSVEEVMLQMHRKIKEPVSDDPAPDTSASDVSVPDVLLPDTSKSDVSNLFDTVMAEEEINGYLYIGYLSISSLGLELPVMSKWDYSRLKIAPCRYSGSAKTDDFVIAAHNYARHFGTLEQLSAGDEVFFTDMTGTVFRYQVAEVVTLEPAAVEEMTAGEYDLTLFTCTYSGKSRVTVRCEHYKK